MLAGEIKFYLNKKFNVLIQPVCRVGCERGLE
jgi:hypothetical protein